MSISIRGGSTSAASTGASGGTDLQRAYQAAAKDLRQAQQQLTKDSAAKASEETIKADQLAVQLAQDGLAQAAAAIAKANADAQQQKADEQKPAGAPAAAVSSASDPKNPVDLYA
ncbi:hypothetical protein ASC77_10070 [Nocardioides sp. Root1257]|uniref:hypothetical protein n=1 Tax=unclassified Nocardioides TaxID=2615069 RepID=UPI0006F4CF5B|nr:MULTISPECIES: hypothetical protein [unclassified Nocardioides]KQW49043.1 hypothetical protein ASC77_10070 [Nocardioides sp. Root1257]KRC48217.1 hypothetical protein ASE24_10075 [Nocardioides sp. Root224]